jgi:hypothetical protein
MDALITVEACVDTVASAVAAERGGAHRVELCDNLADAGTTPSHGTIVAALQALTIPVFPIIHQSGVRAAGKQRCFQLACDLTRVRKHCSLDGFQAPLQIRHGRRATGGIGFHTLHDEMRK